MRTIMSAPHTGRSAIGQAFFTEITQICTIHDFLRSCH